MCKDGNTYKSVVQSVEPGLLWIAPLHSIPKFIAFGKRRFLQPSVAS